MPCDIICAYLVKTKGTAEAWVLISCLCTPFLFSTGLLFHLEVRFRKLKPEGFVQIQFLVPLCWNQLSEFK